MALLISLKIERLNGPADQISDTIQKLSLQIWQQFGRHWNCANRVNFFQDSILIVLQENHYLHLKLEMWLPKVSTIITGYRSKV